MKRSTSTFARTAGKAASCTSICGNLANVVASVIGAQIAVAAYLGSVISANVQQALRTVAGLVILRSIRLTAKAANTAL